MKINYKEMYISLLIKDHDPDLLFYIEYDYQKV